jgi:hypothetical protein
MTFSCNISGLCLLCLVATVHAVPNSKINHLGSEYETESLPFSFNRADTSGDGEISEAEAAVYIAMAEKEVEGVVEHDIASDVQKLFADCDADRNGKLTQDEVKDLSTLVGTKHGNFYEFYARYRSHIHSAQRRGKGSKLGTMSEDAKSKGAAAAEAKYEL